jgi:hypothetical protein
MAKSSATTTPATFFNKPARKSPPDSKIAHGMKYAIIQ